MALGTHGLDMSGRGFRGGTALRLLLLANLLLFLRLTGIFSLFLRVASSSMRRRFSASMRSLSLRAAS